MRKPMSIVMVVCGILVLVGIFLDWNGGSSGWDMMTSSWLGPDDFPTPIFILIGALLMIGCSGWVLVQSLMDRGNLRTLRTLEIVSLVGATLAAGPAICTLIPNAGDAEYGLYISTVLAIVGVIVGAVAATRVTKKRA